MATLTKQKVVAGGTIVTPVAAAAGGDQFANDGKTMLRVVNGGASPCVVTVHAQRNCERGVTHDGGGSVAAGVTKEFGLFPKAWFDDSNGNVQVTYDQVTSVTVAAVQTVDNGM